jgi:solute carrier family 13 (sodium-dependent dicarboxylate transporter), member 2/3/5
MQHKLSLFAGIAAASVCFLLLSAAGHTSAVCWTASLTVLCAVWWFTEAVPIPVTAMVPLALFPAVGVLTPAQVGEAYGSPTILLVLGGFLLSAALVKSQAHFRLAIGVVRLIGGHSSRRLVFGFILAAAALSMWISNAATSLMLLPVALAVLKRSSDPLLATPLLLGMAYGSNIGGLGTPIGTPANLVFLQVYSDTTGTEVSFWQWMLWGVPIVIVLLPVIGIWLTRGLSFRGAIELPQVGRWQTHEKRVLMVFAITAIAWMTRSQPFGGWSELFGVPSINDASIALLGAVALFLIPNGRGEKLLDWDTAAQVPWGILVLLGSGFAIATAFTESGLSHILGGMLVDFTMLPVLLMMLIFCLFVTFMTELTSNTATTALLMPILAGAAVTAGVDPLALMLPAAMSASCAFMLPTATTPNAVAFSTGHFRISTMAREGLAINLFGVVVIALLIYAMVIQRI